jgi:hypothetical protein
LGNPYPWSATFRAKRRSLLSKSYGRDGLSFVSSAEKTRVDMNFDGKQYPWKGTGVLKPATASGKRLNAHQFQLEDQVEGKPDAKDEFSVSDDGKIVRTRI